MTLCLLAVSDGVRTHLLRPACTMRSGPPRSIEEPLSHDKQQRQTNHE